jgi:hypothetical protein
MKQVPPDKYTIAWFKLAEFVARGEKERALGIYRLLCYSFDDKAFAHQLEGDILWAFNDSQASDRYFQAAQLYKQDNRILQAAAVYEHLATLHSESIEYMQSVVELYTLLNDTHKMKVYADKLNELHSKNSQTKKEA